jgi:cell division protein FtsB
MSDPLPPTPTVHRVLLAVLPALVLVVIGASAIWGESGLLARNKLQQRLEDANEELAALERENQRLVRELQVLERDPLALERVIAEELEWAEEGTVIYRFPAPTGRRAGATGEVPSRP